MIILRGLGTIFGLFVCFTISLLTKIDFATILGIVAFVLAIDTVISDILARIYMQAVYRQLEEKMHDIGKNRKDTDGRGE